jgi:lipopolysaccharide/colanic/teichoic acid biosynthesis glycosyltransferase
MSDSRAISLVSLPSRESASQISWWCHSAEKRTFDVCCGLMVLAAALPLFLLIAVLIKLTSDGPILFRQNRVGKEGREFELLKFRTMTFTNHERGPGLTRAGDVRVTRLGRMLRRWKFDELPQLINLLRGDMSLVGPRPDLAEFWSELKPAELRVLSLVPGITGWATLHFRNEEKLLAEVPEEQVRQYYLNEILPRKVDLDLEYAARATFAKDVAILFQTGTAIFR